MIFVFVKIIDMKYGDINLLYDMNFIEEYNYNNNSNYGINTPPKCPKYVMGQGWHIHLIALGGTCDNHHTHYAMT